MKNYSFPKFTRLCVKWLGRYLCKVSLTDLTLALELLEKIILVLHTRGKRDCIRYTKEIRLAFQKSMFNNDPEFEDVDQRVNVPKVLRPLIKRIKETKNYPLIRLALSILFSTRSLRLEQEPSFETIEAGPSFKYENASHLVKDMILFLKANGINTTQLGKRPKRLNFSTFQMTSKSGPNGHALWSSYLDYSALTERQKECIAIVGGDKLAELARRYYNLSTFIPDFFNGVSSPRKGTTITRKITCIEDKEGKTREVAILDYWSQSALYPLHRFQLRFLDRVNQDCTSNQTKKFKWLRARKGHSYWSIDLTAATDRFPIEIQKQLLTVWFGAEYAEAWYHLMVGTPFSYRDRLISYNTGNPMGAYSSFNTFAICHHFFVYLACKKAKVSWKECPYMLLGDDIVIAHDAVSMEYIKLLTEWGVDVSRQKTHRSKTAFEFAKQIRLNKNNISHFPISALFDRRSETFTSAGIIANEIWNKEWNVDVVTVIKNYFIDVLRWPRPRFRAFAPTLELSIGILGYLKGRSKLGTAILRYVHTKTGVEFTMDEWNLDLYSKFLCLIVIHRLFLQSKDHVVSKNNKKPLGVLAEQMVIHITSLDETVMGEAFDYIEATPFLQIYGHATETWMNLRSDLSIYQLGESAQVFRKMFDKIDIPGSDEAFYTRHRDIVMIQASKSAKLISEMVFSIPYVIDERVDLDIKVPWSAFCEDRYHQYKINEVNG